jgi:hypothetical protein
MPEEAVGRRLVIAGYVVPYVPQLGSGARRQPISGHDRNAVQPSDL